MIGNLALTPDETLRELNLLSGKPMGKPSSLDKMMGEADSFATDIKTGTSSLHTWIPGS